MSKDQLYYVTEDVIGHKGNVYALKGDQVTILDRTPGTECDVVLIKNGRDKAWIQEKFLTDQYVSPAKIIKQIKSKKR